MLYFGVWINPLARIVLPSSVLALVRFHRSTAVIFAHARIGRSAVRDAATDNVFTMSADFTQWVALKRSVIGCVLRLRSTIQYLGGNRRICRDELASTIIACVPYES